MEQIGHNSFKAIERRIAVGTRKYREGARDSLDGLIEVAIATAEARRAFSADQEFGDWWSVENNYDVEFDKDERTALVKMGNAGEDAIRLMFHRSEKRSWRYMVSEGELDAALETLKPVESVSLPSETDNVEPYSEEQPEIEPEIPVSVETAAENTEIKVEIREPQPVHRGMLKTIGEDDAAFVSNFYISGNGVAKGMISDISKLNDGPRAVRKLIKELKTGLYGEFSTATTNKKELYPLMFVPGLPQKWSPPKFPTKATPASLNKIIDMMPMMKAVADTLAAEPRRPTNLSDFCDREWRRLAQEALDARKAAEPAQEALAEPVQARPTLTVINGSAGDVPPLARGEEQLEAFGIVFWPMPRRLHTAHQPTYQNVQKALSFAVQIMATGARLGNSGSAVSREINHFAGQIEAMSVVPGAVDGAIDTLRRFSSRLSSMTIEEVKHHTFNRSAIKTGAKSGSADNG